MAREPLYTLAQCEAELRSIDEDIRKVRSRAASAGGDGVYYSNMGRLRELGELREVWEVRRRDALAYEEGAAPRGQGPDFEVY